MALNVILYINPQDTQSGAYPVQLWCEGKPLAEALVHIDRQQLLELEHQYDAHDYGMALFHALFTDNVGRAYQRLMGQAGATALVRVQLVIAEKAAELQVLPWERLFHVMGNTDAPLATSAQTPFSRFLISGFGDQPSVTTRPLRLLVAIANPTALPADFAALDVTDEVQALADVLAGWPGQVVGTVLPGRSGLPDALAKRLIQEGWKIANGVTSWANIQCHLQAGQHILHILAHGQLKSDGTAHLFLEHEGDDTIARGSMVRVPDEDIENGLAGVHPLPQLIFLAACESAKRPADNPNPFVGLAPKLVEKGVPAVVAMQDLMPIELAHTLTVNFYRRLFDHRQVDRALNEARSLLFKANQFEWAIPILFLRLEGGSLSLPPLSLTPLGMVFVRGGPFLMGSQPADGVPAAETPQHSVTLGDYYIGKYPITNREYAEFIKQVKSQDVPAKAGWFNRKPPADRLDYPVTGVSWRDAVAYCAWLSTDRHYRLPSEAEWEKAARGDDGRRYPWGETWGEEYANVGNQGPTPVSAHPLGASPYGCEDMIGNVEEWTRTLWGSQWTPPEFGYPYDEKDGRTIAQDADLPVQGKVIQRGGSYRAQPEEPSCARRGCADPDSKIPWRGFRVVMEV